MLYVIILVFLVIGLKMYLDGYYIYLGYTFFGCAVVLGVLVILGCNYVEKSYYYDEAEIARTQQLVALSDNTKVNGEISGSIRYFSGTINEDQCFNFYYIKNENVIARDSIPASKTDIVYDAKCEEDIVVVTWKREAKTNLNKVVKFLLGPGEKPETQIWYEIHLAKGTVEESLILDNE